MTKQRFGATARMMIGVLLVLAIATVCLGSNPRPVYAQCGGDIALGNTVRGELRSSYCDYYLNGRAGDTVTIRMNRLSSALDPYLELYTPEGGRTASDDDSGGNNNSLISYRLPSSGRYTIRATSYGGTRGSFELAVSGSSSSGCGGVIQVGQAVQARISSAGQRCQFTFSGVYSAAVNITMVKRSGKLDPYLELIDPNGRTVARDDDSYGDYNSYISNYVLPSAGTYTIVARDYGSGTGTFELALWAW